MVLQFFSDQETEMYYNAENGRFVRKEYNKEMHEIMHCGREICIKGIMGTTHRASVEITVYPKN